MSAIIFDERIVHYEVLGRGRPIVFLHGWVGSWRYWFPAMQTTSTTFRAYALDLWGFGDTAHEQSHYSLEQQADLLNRFLLELGIGRVALIGHGLGALVAIWFSRKNPAMVDRLMVVDIPLDGIVAVNSRLRSPASPADLADWLLTRDLITEPARMDAPKADLKAITTSISSLNDSATVLVEMQIPCLLVHGQNDPAIALPSEPWLKSMPEHLHQIVFEQSGHFPMLDESPKFNRLLTDFLGLDSGESPRDLQLKKEEWKRRVR